MSVQLKWEIILREREHRNRRANENHIEKIDRVILPLLPEGAPIALFDFPSHSNVGDSAIWLGETRYLAQHCSSRISFADSDIVMSMDPPRLPESTVILVHGGGNFGDLYPRHQKLRLKLIQHYRQHRIIQLPQSIHFESQEGLEQSRQVFALHNDFHLLVRDLPSLRTASSIHHGNSQLCPDMALCLGELLRPSMPSVEILGLLRSDQESVYARTLEEREYIQQSMTLVDWLEESPTLVARGALSWEALQRRYPRRLRRLYGKNLWVYNRLAAQRVCRGVNLLSQAKVVITDRLHAHLLCVLMGIPHVVLDNSYGKIASFRAAWNTGGDLCHTATGLEHARELAGELLQRMGL